MDKRTLGPDIPVEPNEHELRVDGPFTEERREKTRRSDFDERLRTLEDWKHQVELQAIRKLSDLAAHHEKIDDAIEMLAKAQSNMVLTHENLASKVHDMDAILKQTRTAIITMFMTAIVMVGIFSLGPSEFLRAILSK